MQIRTVRTNEEARFQYWLVTPICNADPHLVCVAADRSDSLNSEVKGLHWEASRLQEWHDEAAEAAIDVQTDVVLLSQLAQGDDVVLAAVWEVYC